MEDIECFVFFLLGCLLQQGDKLCLSKGCRQQGKTVPEKTVQETLLQSFWAFVHRVLCYARNADSVYQSTHCSASSSSLRSRVSVLCTWTEGSGKSRRGWSDSVGTIHNFDFIQLFVEDGTVWSKRSQGSSSIVWCVELSCSCELDMELELISWSLNITQLKRCSCPFLSCTWTGTHFRIRKQ